MTILATSQPLPFFADKSGAPLQSGKIYFGQPNQNPETFPKTVFWDLAGTQPAPQPLGTLSGYISRSGAPVNVFIDGDYSITVKDKRNSLVMYIPSAAALTDSQIILNQIAAFSLPSGSSLVGFVQAGSGSVASTAQSKLRERISVKDFGAVGDGVTNDASAIQLAINQAKIAKADVYFPGGSYYVNSTVSLKDKVSIFGSGKAGSEIFFGPSGKFDLTGTPGGEIGRLSIQNIGLTNQGGGATTGVTMSYATRVLIQNCVIYNTSVSMSAVNYMTVDSVDAFGGEFYVDHPVVDSISEAVKFFNVNGSSYSIRVKDTADVMIAKCSLLGPTAQINISRGEQPAAFYPPVFISDTVVDAGENEGVLLFGVAPHLNNVWVSSGRTNLKNGISISNSVEGSLVNCTARFCGDSGLFLGSCRGLNVVGCTFNDNKTNGVSLNNATYIRFVGNSMGNAPSWYGGSYPQVSGISDIPSNSTNITFVENQVTGNTGLAVYLPSNTNIIYGNNGYIEGRLLCDSWRNNSDNAASLGTSSARWSVVYAATGTINTSDEREKTQFRIQSEAEKRVANLIKSQIKAFKFSDAIALKGSNARWHFGVGAQTVAAAFQSEGLDPSRYALFCYDEWEGGNRYGIRYDELSMFILANL